MELKDVILSTLAEIEQLSVVNEEKETIKKPIEIHEELKQPEPVKIEQHVEQAHSSHEDEIRILDGIRERLLVLFEGFQSPNNVQLEAKVDLTLNFLEYLLATIDNRLETIKEKA